MITEMFMLFVFASAGASLIVTLSSIFEPLRNLFNMKDAQRQENILEGSEQPTAKEKRLLFFKDLIHCPMCFGFWMGVVMYFFMGGGVENLGDIGIVFAHACAASIASLLGYSVLKN